MKQLFYMLCAGLALVSCSKEEVATQGPESGDTYTFNLTTEEPDYVAASRAEAPMVRYLLEMYPERLSAKPTKYSSTDGTFSVELKKGLDYICLFWADLGADAYNASDLWKVTQTDPTKPGTVAYFARADVNSKRFNGNITLKRAVAELSFIDHTGLAEGSNSLKITLPYATAEFRVSDGTVAYTSGQSTQVIPSVGPSVANGVFAVDYLLAPIWAYPLEGIKLQLNAYQEKVVEVIEVQGNFKTKITGDYQPRPVL